MHSRISNIGFGILCFALAAAPIASAATKSKKAHSTSATSKAHKASTTHASSHSKTALHTTSHSTSSHSKSSKKGKKVAKSWKNRGQHGIQSDRTREIQEALIRQNYLNGDATGVWDDRTKEAMRKFQGDHGWQTKVLPDSRALITLGLGPDHSNVLNPETAQTSPYLPGGGEKSSPPPLPDQR